MLLSEARQYVRDNARNAGSSSAYTEQQIDRVINKLVTAVTHELKLPKLAVAIAFVGGSNSIDISSLVSAGFEPHHFLEAYITSAIPGYDPVLNTIDYAEMLKMIAEDSTQAVPRYLAFPTSSTCVCYPTPEISYSGSIRWFKQFTQITPGAAGTTVIDVPTEVLLPILTEGCPLFLMRTQPESTPAALQTMSWYRDAVNAVSGIGNLTAKVTYRESPMWR